MKSTFRSGNHSTSCNSIVSSVGIAEGILLAVVASLNWSMVAPDKQHSRVLAAHNAIAGFGSSPKLVLTSLVTLSKNSDLRLGAVQSDTPR
jgi:hypothetical protein